MDKRVLKCFSDDVLIAMAFEGKGAILKYIFG